MVAFVKAFVHDLEAGGRPIDNLTENVGVLVQGYNAADDGREEMYVIGRVRVLPP